MPIAAQPQPRDHVVQFYEDETFLTQSVAEHLKAGAEAGERLLVLLTPPHLSAVLQRLETEGMDTRAAMASGELVVHDAQATLALIMRDGMPVRALFEQHLLADLDTANPRPTRAFGELVDLLCAEGNPEAAVRLEAFWHEACGRLPLNLLCGYALQNFHHLEDHDVFDAICDHHFHVRPAERYSQLEPEQQLREVSALQQKVHAYLHQDAERAHTENARTENALHDPLTGLTKREHARQRLAELINGSSSGGNTIAVLQIGIDHMKAINESLGPEMGDHFLYQTAQRIRHCLDGDTVVSRLESAEILVLLAGFEQSDEVWSVVRNLLEATSRPVELAGHQILASCSIGVSLFPEHGTTVTELLRHANLATQHAQRLGHGQSFCFTPELVEDHPDRLALRAAIGQALPRGEMVLHYRPQICAYTGQVVAVSATPRWHSGLFGVMEPSDWMAIAEEAGQIATIGQWLLTNVCRQTEAWFESGAGLRVTVHISTADFLDSGLVSRVGEALTRSGLPGEMLELELTESTLMRVPRQTETVLKRLKALGVRLAVDRFGSSHSILEYLNRFPIDSLKINSKFIEDCIDNRHHQAIIRSMISMAHQLDLTITASGVATQQQADYLRTLGCNFLQGSLWASMDYRDTSNEAS